MRLWHYKLIPYLPNSQLIAQWRELNAIFKNQPNHILINYVYEYSKKELFKYTHLIINEMNLRGFKLKVKSYENCENYFKGVTIITTDNPFISHHNNRCLLQCFYNLQEKYDRGQKDFTEERYKKLEEFIKNEIHKNSLW